MKHWPNFRTVGILLLILTLVWSCKKEKIIEVPTAKVMKGTFWLEIYEEGEVEAINSTSVSSPNISWRYGNLKITSIIKDGTEVSKGDTLVSFDPSEVKKGVVEAEGRLEMNIAEMARMEAQQQSDLDELKSDYEVSRLSLEISKIRFESAAYEADIKKKEIKLNLDKAQIALDRAKEQIDNRVKIQKEEIKQKNLSIEQDKARVTEANETMDKLYLLSPSSGIAIINRNWSTGNKFQVGDQCWAGFPLIQLPDLSTLRAVVKINEVDIAKITPGLKVEIKPDAFSDSTFHGEVISVANLAVNKDDKSKVKVFPVEIKINARDKKLLPGLTVSCRIILGKISNALYLPLEAVKLEGGKNYVWLKTVKGYEKTFIETGESNKNYLVITKGVSAGDVIALSDPTGKEDKKKDEKNQKSTPEQAAKP
jgi:RND family efflux transporter MFP subunit